MNASKIFNKRVGMSLFGVVLCAISVGIFKIAALGVDPFQSFMAGLDSLVPISFGTLYVIANAPSSTCSCWDISRSLLMSSCRLSSSILRLS